MGRGYNRDPVMESYDRIKNLIFTESGMTRNVVELSKITGVPAPTLYSNRGSEHNNRSMSLLTAIRCLQKLNISPDEIGRAICGK